MCDVRLSELGPFFALQDTSDAGDWHSLAELTEGPALEERVDHAATFLGQLSGRQVEPRVAASTMSLGLFARLVAPPLGAAALGVELPPFGLDSTYWQPVPGGPWPLALTGAPVSPDLSSLLHDVVLPLASVIGDRFSLSDPIVRGNVASAVFGAVRMIGSARPDLLTEARGLGRSLLDGPLAGTGDLGEEFVRSSCCLYYRIPGGGYCGDCVLAHR